MSEVEQRLEAELSGGRLVELARKFTPGVYFSNPNRFFSVTAYGSHWESASETVIMEIFNVWRNLVGTGEKGWNSENIRMTQRLGQSPKIAIATRSIWDKGEGHSIELSSFQQQEGTDTIYLGRYIDLLNAVNHNYPVAKFAESIDQTRIGKVVKAGPYVSNQIRSLLQLSDKEEKGLITLGSSESTRLREADLSQGVLSKDVSITLPVGDRGDLVTVSHTREIHLDSLIIDSAGTRRVFAIEPPACALQKVALDQGRVIFYPAGPKDVIHVIRTLESLSA